MSTIFKALKVRLYPSKEQETLINKTLGCSRFIYNQMLAERIEVYEKLKEDKRALYEYKYKTEKQYKEDYEWLKEVDSIALQQARMNLSMAYQNFFKSLSGKRKGKSGFPNFKKKKSGSSYTTTMVNNNVAINFETQEVKLPKIGKVKFRDHRTSFAGIIKSATVSRTSTGKYFVSLLFEQEFEYEGVMIDESLKTKTIGLDMSLDKFFVDDNGNSPAYERLYRQHEKKLKMLQRRVSKKKLGSSNRKKAQHKINVIHEKIANKRKDFTQKLSTKIVKENTVIVVEHLSLKAMSQALNLGKSIMDLGFSQFVNQLQYKSLWNNKIFIQADKWFASSKTCSICGYKNSSLPLSDRVWECPNCGQTHDRDTNAGKNLKQYGLQDLGLGQSDFKPVERKTAADLSASFLDEAGSPCL
jgi:putative transposase